MPSYSYELRRDGDIISTGHFSTEAPLRVGDDVAVAGVLARVEEILPSDSPTEERVVLRTD